MTPTIGRIVHYSLSAEDAQHINHRRTDGESIKQRMFRADQNFSPPHWPYGAQAHIGVLAKGGDTLPALVVYVNPVTAEVDLQVFLRGNDVLYVAGALQATD